MSYLGDLNVSTGIDTSVRPGESVYEYAARIAREQAEYMKFAQGSKAVSPLPPGMQPAVAPPVPASRGMSNTTKLMLVGVGVGAFLLMRRRR